MPEFRPCPACRGYALEASWCHKCGGKGVVDAHAEQQLSEAILGLLERTKFQCAARGCDGCTVCKENDRA